VWITPTSCADCPPCRRPSRCTWPTAASGGQRASADGRSTQLRLLNRTTRSKTPPRRPICRRLHGSPPEVVRIPAPPPQGRFCFSPARKRTGARSSQASPRPVQPGPAALVVSGRETRPLRGSFECVVPGQRSQQGTPDEVGLFLDLVGREADPVITEFVIGRSAPVVAVELPLVEFPAVDFNE
jgi:hypothetical protein